MAEIDIQRKKSVWPWIIAAIVLIAIIWALFEFVGNDEAEVYSVAEEPVASTPMAGEPTQAPSPADVDTSTIGVAPTPAPMPPPPTEADNTPIPVSVIIVGPTQFLGQPVIGTAQVADVPADRGFWIEQDGQKMFAVIAASGTMEDAVDLNPGQRVRLAGVIYDSAMASTITDALTPETRQVIANQPAFLLVDARNIVLAGDS